MGGFMSTTFLRNVLLLLCVFFITTFAKLTHTYTFNAPTITEDSALSLPHCTYSFQTGTPAVPVKPVMLLLPEGETATHFTITYGKSTTKTSPTAIRPLTPGQILSAVPQHHLVTHYISTDYKTNTFFPAQQRDSKDFSIMQKNGHNIFVTTINPVQYNPVTREIRHFETVTLSIETESDKRSSHFLKSDPITIRNINALVDNPQRRISKSVTEEIQYDYLVVTSKNLVTHFTPFIEFNKTRCLRTKIIDIETIKSTMTGNDTQDKIRNYIKQEYETSKITYVLLAGDVTAIPHRGFDAELYDYGTDHFHFHNIPADMYYGCLDGTWKNSGDTYYGKPGSEDLGFDVYVSRITVETATDIEVFITKVTRFVSQPITETILNIGLAGEYLWSKPQSVYGDEHMNELIGSCSKNGFTTEGVSTDFSVDTSLYGRKYSNWEKYSSAMPNMIKQFEPTWISHLGHSSTDYTMGFRNSNVTKSNFPQNGQSSNYFFMYTQGCFPNAFDNCAIGSPLNNEKQSGSFYSDAISEKLTLLETGCIAFLGNTRFGFGCTQGTDGSNQRFMRWFHHALFGEKISSLEMMNAFSKEKNAPFWTDENINGGPYYGQCRWVCYQLNLLGDPALAMYSEVPTNIEVTLPDTLTKAEFTLTTEPYARVSLFDEDNEFIYSDIADANGEVFISSTDLLLFFKNNSIGTITIGIYADNHLPFTQELHYAIEFMPVLQHDNHCNSFAVSVQKSKISITPFSNVKGDIQISITDIKGKLLQKESHSASTKKVKLFQDISNLAQGIYFLRYTQGDISETIKFTK